MLARGRDDRVRRTFLRYRGKNPLRESLEVDVELAAAASAKKELSLRFELLYQDHTT